MSRFPHLPETFILREMSELERLGWRIALYPLLVQRQAIVQDDARRWLPRVRRPRFASPSVLVANAAVAARSPAQLAGTWAQALWENRGAPGFLVRTAALLPMAADFARRMRREGVVHVHAHYATHPALMAWAIHRLAGIPYSVTVHAHDIFVRRDMLALKLREAQFVLAISEFNRDFLAGTLGDWVRAKTRVVRCGIEPERYVPRAEPRKPDERLELISVGSLQPYKGYEVLVRACALLRERGLDFHCRIVGEGPERERLERQVTRAGLEQVVHLIGPRTEFEVARLLPSAHAYVQPSVVTAAGKMEGIPVALMEAMACGLPAVASAISGIPELVLPGKMGTLVPPGDPAYLADALAGLHADPEGAARMGLAGRQRVLEDFNLHSNVRGLASIFESAIGARRQSYRREPATTLA